MRQVVLFHRNILWATHEAFNFLIATFLNKAEKKAKLNFKNMFYLTQ